MSPIACDTQVLHSFNRVLLNDLPIDELNGLNSDPMIEVEQRLMRRQTRKQSDRTIDIKSARQPVSQIDKKID